MGIIKENKKMVSVHFDCMTDLMEFKPPAIHSSKFKRYMFDNTSSPKWYGPNNTNASHVMNKALLGDELLFKKLDTYIAELDKLTGYHTRSYETVIPVLKRRRKCDAYGDELDIHKVYQGKLDQAWTRTERIEISSKLHLVTLLIDIGGSSNQDAADSVWRSAVAVKLLRELEQSGKSVKIVAGIASSGAFVELNKILTSTITIKDYNQNVSLERLAAMSHLGFMRTFCFGGFYSQKYSVFSGLGRPVDMDKQMPIHLQEEVDAGHTKYVYLGRAMTSYSAMNCLKSAYEQMEEFANVATG